jgi:hypothetical protein
MLSTGEEKSGSTRVIFWRRAGGSSRAFWAWPLAWPSPSGPLGRQRSPGSRVGARAHRRGDATGGSALDAGGADPENARRSGLVLVTFPRRPAHRRRTTGPASSRSAGPTARYGGSMAAARCGASALGSGPRRCAIALEEAGQAARHLRRDSPPPRPLRRALPARSTLYVHVLRILREIKLGRSAWRAECAPLIATRRSSWSGTRFALAATPRPGNPAAR